MCLRVKKSDIPKASKLYKNVKLHSELLCNMFSVGFWELLFWWVWNCQKPIRSLYDFLVLCAFSFHSVTCLVSQYICKKIHLLQSEVQPLQSSPMAVCSLWWWTRFICLSPGLLSKPPFWGRGGYLGLGECLLRVQQFWWRCFRMKIFELSLEINTGFRVIEYKLCLFFPIWWSA